MLGILLHDVEHCSVLVAHECFAVVREAVIILDWMHSTNELLHVNDTCSAGANNGHLTASIARRRTQLNAVVHGLRDNCLLYTSPSPRDS